MLAAVADAPALLPPEVMATYDGAVAPAEGPGHWVPLTVPDDVVLRLKERVQDGFAVDDMLAVLVVRGFDGKHPVDPPTEPAWLWPEEKRSRALLWMQLAAEVAWRVDAAQSGYRPWTAEEICRACYGNFRSREWTWRGVRAIPSRLSPGAFVITCGMLRDAGAIETAAQCAEEDRAAIARFVAETVGEAEAKAAAKMAPVMMAATFAAMVALAGSVSVAAGAMSAAAAGAISGAVSTLSQVGARLATDPKSLGDERAILDILRQVASSVAPVVGPYAVAISAAIDASKTAIDFVEAAEARRGQERALDEQRERVEARGRALAAALAQRAELAELNAEIARLEAEVRGGGPATRSGWVLPAGLAVLAAVLLAGRS